MLHETSATFYAGDNATLLFKSSDQQKTFRHMELNFSNCNSKRSRMRSYICNNSGTSKHSLLG